MRTGSRSSTSRNGRRRCDFYVDLMKDAGPPGASSNGFNENLALFQQGKCGMWIDATVAASFVTNPKDSTVADKVGFALAPDNGLGKRGNWLWAWSLAIPAGSQKAEAAAEVHLLGDQQGLPRRSSPPRKAGPTFLRARAPRSTTTRSIRQAAPFAEDDARLDQLGRPDQPDREAGALCRRAVRGHSRVRRVSAPRSASSSRPHLPARCRSTTRCKQAQEPRPPPMTRRPATSSKGNPSRCLGRLAAGRPIFTPPLTCRDGGAS